MIHEEGRFLLFFFTYEYLMVTLVGVHETFPFEFVKGIYLLVNLWEWVAVLREIFV